MWDKLLLAMVSVNMFDRNLLKYHRQIHIQFIHNKAQCITIGCYSTDDHWMIRSRTALGIFSLLCVDRKQQTFCVSHTPREKERGNRKSEIDKFNVMWWQLSTKWLTQHRNWHFSHDKNNDDNARSVIVVWIYCLLWSRWSRCTCKIVGYKWVRNETIHGDLLNLSYYASILSLFCSSFRTSKCE